MAPEIIKWEIWKEHNRRLFEEERMVKRLVNKLEMEIVEIVNNVAGRKSLKICVFTHLRKGGLGFSSPHLQEESG